MLSRRSVSLAALAIVVLPGAQPRAAARPPVTVYRDPSCDCCGAWAKHLETGGFPVAIVETTKLNPLKAEKGVPKTLWSCHTAEVGGYVIEGHVPAAEIDRLLAERPAAIGLSVRGMPIGSPGMEMEGHDPAPYDILLFAAAGQSTYARYKGSRRIE